LRGPQRDDQIAVAQAGVDAAEANLARIKSPPQPSELTALEAQVDAANGISKDGCCHICLVIIWYVPRAITISV
jgi:hypothetical protein